NPGPPPTCPTPQSEVAVRDLRSSTTRLISVTPEGLPTPGGGAFPSAESEEHMDAPAQHDQPASSAAISGDGSTVAWLGTNVPYRAPRTSARGATGPFPGAGKEVEPLWRRVAGGATKRLLGEADLDFSYSPGNSELVRGGSFVDTEGAYL